MRHRLRQNYGWHLLWIIPLAILIIPIIIIASPFIIIKDKKLLKEAKKFWTENQDRTLFFYSNKHGWGDFVSNNIIPALPPKTSVYNLHRDKPNPIGKINIIIDRKKIPWEKTRLPFIIKLKSNSPLVYSFNSDYSSIKKEIVKRNKDLQDKIRQTIIEKINGS